MKRHPFDAFSFAVGLLFMALGAGFLLAGADLVDERMWLWPIVLVGLGVAGLASALRRPE